MGFSKWFPMGGWFHLPDPPGWARSRWTSLDPKFGPPWPRPRYLEVGGHRNTRRFHQLEAKADWKRWEVFCHFDFLNHFFLRLSWDFFLLEFMWIKIDTKPEFALFVGNLLLGVFLLMPTRVLGLTSNEFKWNIHKAFMHLSYCVVLELSSRINGHQVGGSKKCWHRGRTVPNTSVQHPTWPSDISNRIVFFVCFLADTVSRVSCHSNFWCESPFLIAQHVIIDDHYIYIYIYI